MHPALPSTTTAVEALPNRRDDTRSELIEGELAVAKQPHLDHQLTPGPHDLCGVLQPGAPTKASPSTCQPDPTNGSSRAACCGTIAGRRHHNPIPSTGCTLYLLQSITCPSSSMAW